jgi:protein ImuB
MSAFSENRRRILSLWLPRLPIDRIKRQLQQVKRLSSEAVIGSREGSALNHPKPLDEPGIVVARQNNMLRISALDDAAAHFGLAVGLPLANARAIWPMRPPTPAR